MTKTVLGGGHIGFGQYGDRGGACSITLAKQFELALGYIWAKFGAYKTDQHERPGIIA